MDPMDGLDGTNPCWGVKVESSWCVPGCWVCSIIMRVVGTKGKMYSSYASQARASSCFLLLASCLLPPLAPGCLTLTLTCPPSLVSWHGYRLRVRAPTLLLGTAGRYRWFLRAGQRNAWSRGWRYLKRPLLGDRPRRGGHQESHTYYWTQPITHSEERRKSSQTKSW